MMRDAECGMRMERRTWRSFLALILLAVCLVPPAFAKDNGIKPDVIIDPAAPRPGDIMVVTVKGATGPVEGKFGDRKIYFNPSKDSLKALVGIDLFTEPGTYTLDLSVDGTAVSRSITVVKKEYPVQRLTLPKDMVELSPQNEARAERDQKKFEVLWPEESVREWDGDFMNPRKGEIVTAFGLRRIINKIPKSPHTGVDVSAELGDAVRAPNNGTVVLVDDMFFTGNSVVLDHGQGIYTMFFHFSKILVAPGQQVKKGDVIGLVGSTGRSTGPHLHWGVRIEGARVDPLELIHLKIE